MIFGPVIAAMILIGVFLLSPFKYGDVSQNVIQQGALSQSKNIFKGTVVKQAAFSQNYVPFMGSSELSRMDAFHPASIAKRYNRKYHPFLLGAAGSQSLSHYFGMQGINSELKNKKIVFIISPQWFVKDGINPGAFAQYYSNLQAVNWLLSQKSTKADQYAAKRVLELKQSQFDSPITVLIRKVANGKKITDFDRKYLLLKQKQLVHEDQLFSTIAMNNRVVKIENESKKLPKKYDIQKLKNKADEYGQMNTTSNDFEISNSFWDKKLKSRVKSLQGSQKNFDYVNSPEYADFQLLLNQFAQNNNDVLLIIPPVNEKWAKYTGLSTSMLKEFDNKINYQLKTQGFKNIVDLSNDGSKPYFMQDTIHLGWNGWLAADQKIKPFLDSKNSKNQYKLDNYFFSKAWQEKNDIK